MGYAIAGALAARGGDVTLVSGRTALPTPAGVQRTDVLSAAEMYDAATAAFDRADGAVMCAAVADYTPDTVSETKIKKCGGEMCITLRRTRDIAAELGARKGSRLLVGFALETHDEQANAEAKARQEKLRLHRPQLAARRRGRIPRRHQQSHLHRPQRPGGTAPDAEVRSRGTHRR